MSADHEELRLVRLLRERQIAREKLQRQAALGRRIASAQDGSLGPVIKRWINASVSPVSQRLQLAASFYLSGDYSAFCSVLDSPVFELRAALEEGAGSRGALNVIFYWMTAHGGRYADDMVLAGLGTAVCRLATRALAVTADRGRRDSTQQGVYLAGLLGGMADAARETAIGQFLTQIQGAETMQRIRRRTGEGDAWQQTKRMDAVAAMLFGQVLPQLYSEGRGEVVLERAGTRSVVKVLSQAGEERRISLKAPAREDWELLEVARKVRGEADQYRQAWFQFALIVLCAAQGEHGWFDLGKAQKQSGKRGKAWSLYLADEPLHNLSHDLERWLQMGFSNDPMIVEPEKGDYLTVKHKQVVGRRGPMGVHTEAEGTLAWNTACEVMGNTAWQINAETLAAINNGGPLWDAALKSSGGDLDTLKNVLGAYAREAGEAALYMPLYMDFRGRVYPRTTWVTYQGTDVQKGLLKFPAREGMYEPRPDALVMHMTNRYGNGLDKEPLSERLKWFKEHLGGLRDVEPRPEEPIQFASAMDLIWNGLEDCIPAQIDGTCNGLQHLSALFRDDLAAPHVNLISSTYEDTKADIYGTVADYVLDMMSRPVGRMEVGGRVQTYPDYIDGNWKWISRSVGNYKVDRKLCKKPVMVLPYGGTFDAIEKAVTQAVLDQKPNPKLWQECLVRIPFAGLVPDDEALRLGYKAFEARELSDHPLFKEDMKKLSQFVLEAIKKTIPRAMSAMDSFREIAKGVGARTLEWDTGFRSPQGEDPSCGGDDSLWVVHAYAVSQRQSLALRGFHLPNSIRGLAMLNGKDEVDPRAHRTGIVANFIHSMDARHLAHTMRRFRTDGGTSFGAIHDCYIARPSEMTLLNASTRMAFYGQYLNDPLLRGVRLRDVQTDKVETFEDWFALAKHFGVCFPDYGKWKPEEVLRSAWFFS